MQKINNHFEYNIHYMCTKRTCYTYTHTRP